MSEKIQFQTLVDSISKLRVNSFRQRQLSSEVKNSVLNELAQELLNQEASILSANKKDLINLDSSATSAFRDRLTLNSQRLVAMADSLRKVASLADPVNEVIEEKTLPNGLKLKKVRSPLGVIFMIFESRPNVIFEAFSLAFKSGNAIVLRGGSDSAETSLIFYRLISSVLKRHGLEDVSFLGLTDYNRDHVYSLLKRKDLIDVVVPRGGEALIDFVQKEAMMPIIKNDRGLCHGYIDDEADIEMAVRLVTNAKSQRPGVCNSLETVLVHEKVAQSFLPKLKAALLPFQTEWRCDDQAALIVGLSEKVKKAKDEDWNTEHLDHILNVKIVGSIEEAYWHIEKYSSRHSEMIVTRSQEKAHDFQLRVDSAAVYWNASTRFTDGYEFGLGGELGISTQKIHVRGPVGLRELTTPRWWVTGSGQIRE